MENTRESPDIANKGIETITTELNQRLLGAINKEMEGLRELAEQESRDIIVRAHQESEETRTRAKEDAAKILCEANLRAEQPIEEAAKIFSEAKLRAEQLIKDAEQRHDSIIAESKKEAEQMINVINNIKENLGSAINDAKQM